MNPRAGKALRLVIGLGALAYLIGRIDLGRAASTVASSKPAWLLAAVAAQAGSKTCWLLRWRTLLSSTGHHRSAGELFRLILVGLFFNNFLPTSVGGDVARGLALANRGVPRATAAASVLGDRLVGLLTLGLMGTAGGALGLVLWPENGPWLAAGGFALVVTIGIAALTRPGVLAAVARGGERIASGAIMTKFSKLLDGLAFLSGRGKVLAVATGLSLGLSICAAVYHWAVASAVGISLPLAAYFVIVPAVMLFAALPITLNGLGIREMGFVGLLGTQGVAAETATVFALLAFAGTLGFAVAGAVVFLAEGRTA